MKRSKIRNFLHNLHSARTNTSQKKVYNQQRRDLHNKFEISSQKILKKEQQFKPYKQTSTSTILPNEEEKNWESQHKQMFQTLYHFEKKTERTKSYLFPAVSAERSKTKIHNTHRIFSPERKSISNVQELNINSFVKPKSKKQKDIKKQPFVTHKRLELKDGKLYSTLYNKKLKYQHISKDRKQSSFLMPWQIKQEQLIELND